MDEGITRAKGTQ